MNNINFEYADKELAKLEDITREYFVKCDIPEIESYLERAHFAVIEAREKLLILKINAEKSN